MPGVEHVVFAGGHEIVAVVGMGGRGKDRGMFWIHSADLSLPPKSAIAKKISNTSKPKHNSHDNEPYTSAPHHPDDWNYYSPNSNSPYY